FPLPLRIVREPQQGVAFARFRALAEARAPILVFIDDDNCPDPDYLEAALSLCERHPEIGCFGGISRGHFERRPPFWTRPLWPYVGVRDLGEHSIASFTEEWYPWEPIGAGMVFRREVGEHFRKWFESESRAQALGRAGAALLSGEDSMLARSAYR